MSHCAPKKFAQGLALLVKLELRNEVLV